MMNKVDEKILGTKIYLARKQKALTLRELSQKSGLSHTQIYRIEKGTTIAKPQALERLMNALDISFKAEKAYEEAFYKIYHELFYNVLYVNYETAKKYFDALYRQRHIYENCRCFTDYYLIMLMVVVHTGHRKDLMEYFFNACELLKDFYDDIKREWFEVMKTLYLHKRFNQEVALSHADALLKTIKNEHYRGILQYTRGTILIADYKHYHDALDAFDEAQKIFEDNLNFNRSNRAKAVKQRIYIYLFRFEDFRTSFKESEAYARKNGVLDLYYFIHLNQAIYYLFDENYDETLRILDTFEFPSATYYMTKAYAFYKLKRDDEALRTLKQFDATNISFSRSLDERLYKLIERGIQVGEDDTYLEMLRDFTDDAIEAHDFPMTKQGVSLLTKLLEKRRRYKEAYHYAGTLLSIINTIH
ncbi:MAG: helix-turn-helix domain-containing protein [Candidatus Izemoplasmataceae bacterium]